MVGLKLPEREFKGLLNSIREHSMFTELVDSVLL